MNDTLTPAESFARSVPERSGGTPAERTAAAASGEGAAIEVPLDGREIAAAESKAIEW